MLELFLARHGQTDFNIEKKIQDPHSPKLTSEGKQQAQGLAKFVKGLRVPPQRIVCANTTRTKQTLEEVYPDYQGRDNVFITDLLNERYHRDLVGMTKEDIENKLDKPLKDRLSWELYFEDTDQSVLTEQHFPNNERLTEIIDRINQLVDYLQTCPSPVLAIGSSIINQYLLEKFQFNTIGEQRVQYDFQSHHQIRLLKLDQNMRLIELQEVELS